MKSKYILISLLLTVFSSCERIAYNNTDVCTCTFTATFTQTKAVNAEGIQTFRAGELIDIWDVSTHELSHVTIAEKDIADAGKTVTFTTDVNPSSDILAVYPGGFGSDCWAKSESALQLNALNSIRDGLATAVCKAGEERILSFTNVLSCVSFSSSKSVSEVNSCAYLYGRNGETFPTSLSVDPATGAASAVAKGSLPYAFTTLAALYPQDIRIWVLPELNLTKGFSLKIGASSEATVKTREVPVPFSVGQNRFVVLGDVDVTTMSFALDVTQVTNMNGNIEFSPSSDDYLFIPCCEKKSKFELFTDDSQITTAVIDYYKEKYGSNWKQSVIDLICRKGVSSVTFTGLDSDTDYIAFVFAVDEELNVISGVTKIPFHTSNLESPFSYEDFLGEWTVSGSTDRGAFENCIWTLSVRENGISYNVSGLLNPLNYKRDSYVAYFNETSHSVNFPVGVNNPGTHLYNPGSSYEFYVFLAGLTSDKRSIVPFDLVSLSSNELQLAGAAYLAGEQHPYDPQTDGPAIGQSVISAPMSISSITRVQD